MGTAVRIVQGPVWSQLEAPQEVLTRVAAALTFKNPAAQFSKAYRRGYWDGMVKFMKLPKGIFMTGLTPRVVAAADIPVQVIKVNVPIKTQLADKLEGVVFREYQDQAVETFIKMGRGTLQVPTGGGKTEIGLDIIRRLGHNTLWLTHLKDLMAQTLERAATRLPGIKIGVIGSGTMDPKFPLTIGMVQSLIGVEDQAFWDAWRFVVFDECHHTSAESWLKLSERLRYCPLRLGLSGTAATKDVLRDLRLEGATGSIIKVISTDDLVNAGFLAKPNIRLVRVKTNYPVGKDFKYLDPQGAARYQAVYQEGIIENEKRNDAIIKIAKEHVAAGDKVLVLVTRLEHGELLKDNIRDQKTWCEWLSGSEPMDRRVGVLETFKRLPTGACLVASPIFDEGVDIPQLDCLILAGAGESTIKLMQRVGRSLRPRPDKSSVVIYDFLDGISPIKGKRVEAGDYLALHSRQRVRDYEAEGFEIERLER